MGMFDHDENDSYYWLEKDNEQLKAKIKTWESRYEILEKMLLNVCRHTYMLKANQINVDQLFAVVNGCLNEEVIDRFTWDYLMDEESKKLKTSKQVKDVMTKYLHEYNDVEIEPDEVDDSDLVYDLKKKEFKEPDVENNYNKIIELLTEVTSLLKENKNK